MRSVYPANFHVPARPNRQSRVVTIPHLLKRLIKSAVLATRDLVDSEMVNHRSSRHSHRCSGQSVIYGWKNLWGLMVSISSSQPVFLECLKARKGYGRLSTCTKRIRDVECRNETIHSLLLR